MTVPVRQAPATTERKPHQQRAQRNHLASKHPDGWRCFGSASEDISEGQQPTRTTIAMASTSRRSSCAPALLLLIAAAVLAAPAPSQVRPGKAMPSLGRLHAIPIPLALILSLVRAAGAGWLSGPVHDHQQPDGQRRPLRRGQPIRHCGRKRDGLLRPATSVCDSLSQLLNVGAA